MEFLGYCPVARIPVMRGEAFYCPSSAGGKRSRCAAQRWRHARTATPPWFETRKKELANRALIREQAFGEALDADELERLGRSLKRGRENGHGVATLLPVPSRACARGANCQDDYPFRVSPTPEGDNTVFNAGGVSVLLAFSRP
jgi:hypothetical protein